MKKFISLLTLITGLALVAPGNASARDYHAPARSVSHSCGSCGSSVYRQKVIVGYDRCGDPIYGWHTDSHRCASSQGGGHRSSGHSSRGHGSHNSGGHFNVGGLHFDVGGKNRRH